MVLRFVAASLAATGVAGHGAMMVPVPRNGLDHANKDLTAGCTFPTNDRNHSVVEHQRSPCYDHMTWFCALDHTGPVSCHKAPDPPAAQFPKRMYSSPPGWSPPIDTPWRAPGTAVPASPCGVHQTNGKDGLALQKTPRGDPWQAGSTVSVAHSLGANHGGGYSWRLCPDESLSTSTSPDDAEKCFQQNPLRFADTQHTLKWKNGTQVKIDAMQTDQGTVPAGSQWRRNPIPANEFCAEFGCGDCSWLQGWDAKANGDCPAFQPPCDGCYGGVVDSHADPAHGFPEGHSNSGHEDFSVFDDVIVPEGLAPGNYVLQWRWDTESLPHQQVWTNCADISVVGKKEMIV